MALAKLSSKIVFCNVPTRNSQAARQFYSLLLGSDDFARAPNMAVESYFRPISEDGTNLLITQRYDDHEALTCYFAVENLDQAIESLQKAGGTLIVPPANVPLSVPPPVHEALSPEFVRRGIGIPQSIARMAVMLDPDRNHVGLVQLTPESVGYFHAGIFQRPLLASQVEAIDVAKRIGATFEQQRRA